MSTKPTPLLARIAAKCEPRGACLVWTGRCDEGHPRVDVPGNSKAVRRVLYEQATQAPLGRAQTLRMTCQTYACVQAGHMEVVPSRKVARKAAAVAPVQRCESVGDSVLPRHLKCTTGVRSVWDLGRAA